MIYEVREYVAFPGRFAALVKMINEHTMRLFAKHEMELVSIGMTTVGESCFNGLTYMMRFESAADWERKWAAYLQDPEFLAALAASEADGPVVQSMKRRLLDDAPFAHEFREFFE